MFDSILSGIGSLFDTITMPRAVSPNVSMPQVQAFPTGSLASPAGDAVVPTINSVSGGTFDAFADTGTSAESMAPAYYAPSYLETGLGMAGSVGNLLGGLGSLRMANEATDYMASQQDMREDAYRRYLAEQEKRQSLNF